MRNSDKVEKKKKNSQRSMYHNYHFSLMLAYIDYDRPRQTARNTERVSKVRE